MRFSYGMEQQAGICLGTVNKIEAQIKSWIDTGYTPMAQYFAARNGVVFLNSAQGKSSPDLNDHPLTVDSLFPISSITKTLTGALVMILTEDGIISPTDFVYRHIPEFDGKGKNRVSIAHLLTHTSGIDDSIWDMEKACHSDNKSEPGTVMAYSSLGLNLVGEIIERATGKPFAALLKERLLIPLGMTNTFLGVPDSEHSRVVKYPENAYFKNASSRRDNFSPSSGAFSTAKDLSVFAQMLLNKGENDGQRVLSRLSVEAMTRNQIPGISAVHDGVRFREAGWGFSLMLSLDKLDETGTLRSPESYGHSGAGCSMFLVDPVNNVVATLLYCTMKKHGDDHFERRFDRFYNMVLSGVI